MDGLLGYKVKNAGKFFWSDSTPAVGFAEMAGKL